MKRSLKIVLRSTLILTLLFVVVLIVHIAMMVGNRPASSFYQLGRVDFSNQMSKAEADQVKLVLANEEGYISSFCNLEGKTMVYKFDTRYNSAEAIYQNAVQKQFPESKRYVVTAEMASQGCPVINDKSFYGRLTAMVTNVMY